MCVCVYMRLCVCVSVSAHAGVFAHFRVFGDVHTWMGVCMFVVSCLATQISRLISLSTSGLDDCRVGRPVTDYKQVVRPWESGIRQCISCHFPTV